MSPEEDRERSADSVYRDLLRRREAGEAIDFEQVCAEHPDLADALRRLRLIYARDDEKTVSVSPGGAAVVDGDPPPDSDPARIGPYKILEVLGEGGFGTVYLAEQEKPVRRRVALKVIKLGMDTKAVMARFEAERQALAMMEHPNVARILDAGATAEGRPYFVMEHVRGIPITAYCDRHRLRLRERLELFIQVCEAIQHAHQKGIVHRDIKPSNVLVSVAGNRAVPKVIDYGVAKAISQKLTEKTVFTEHGQLIGTPEYMSPEQAEMTGLDVDTRSDIYSLGVLLYELLVGSLPFDPQAFRRAGLPEIQRIIREVEPPRPSTRASSLGAEAAGIAASQHTDSRSLIRQVRGDLDWITMKALEKDRTRRYSTASEFAADIERYLRGDAVLAGPPSASYRLKKLLRKHRGPVTAGALVFLSLAVGLIVSLLLYLEARENARLARQRADEVESARREVVDNLYVSLVRQARATRLARQVGYRETALSALEEASGLDTARKDVGELRQEAVLSLGDPAGIRPVVVESFPSAMRCVVLHPEGVSVAVGFEGGEVILLDARNGRRLALLEGHGSSVEGLEFLPQTNALVSAEREGVVLAWRSTNGLWAASQKIVTGHRISALELSARGDSIFCVDLEGDLSEWELDTGESKRKLELDLRRRTSCVAVSPDGAFLAGGFNSTASSGVDVWDLESRELERRFVSDAGIVYSLAFGTDGTLAVGYDEGLAVYHREDFRKVLFERSSWVESIDLAPRHHLVAYKNGHAARLLDFLSGQLLLQLPSDGKPGDRQRVALSRDGTALVSATTDSLRLWKLSGGLPERSVLGGHSAGIPALHYGRAGSSGAVLISASKDRTVSFWDAGGLGKAGSMAGFEGPVQSVACHPGGTLLATGDWAPHLKVWSLPDRREIFDVEHDLDAIWKVEFSPDGRFLAASGAGLAVWRIRGAPGVPGDEREVRSEDLEDTVSLVPFFREEGYRATDLCFSPTSDVILWIDRSRELKILRLGEEASRAVPDARPMSGVHNLAFLEGGEEFVFIAEGGVAEVWSSSSSSRVRTIGSSGDFHHDVFAISPDRRWLAARVRPPVVGLWDTRTGERLFRLPEERNNIWSVAWSPHGEKLALGLNNGGLFVWDLSEIRSLLEDVGLGWERAGVVRAQE